MSEQAVELSFELSQLQMAAKYWPCDDKASAKKTPLLALHGWMDNAASFDRLAIELNRRGYELLAIDLAGHGHSSHYKNKRYLIWEYAFDLVELVKQLQAGQHDYGELLNSENWKHFGLVGLSLGTGVSLLSMPVLKATGLQAMIFIDGLGPLTGKAEEASLHLKESFQQRLLRQAQEAGPKGGIKFFASEEEAVKARAQSPITPLRKEIARALVHRGLKNEGSKFRWRHDPYIQLSSPFRLTEEAAQSFVRDLELPLLVFMAQQGLYEKYASQLSGRIEAFEATGYFYSVKIEGDHHLHMDPKKAPKIAEETDRFLAKVPVDFSGT